ncbi:MAG: hypothetical protein VYE68_10235 [Acidobacteriota bacterium]|nr:hypothetical protein [Acidobacteriota bacterium]
MLDCLTERHPIERTLMMIGEFRAMIDGMVTARSDALTLVGDVDPGAAGSGRCSR